MKPHYCLVNKCTTIIIGTAILCDDHKPKPEKITRTKWNTVWDEKAITILKQMWDDHTTREIAAKLGSSFNHNSVIGKAHRLGLPRKKSPIRYPIRYGED